MKHRVRLIDPIKDEEGLWVCNDIMTIGSIDLPEDCILTPRRLLARLREEDFLSQASKGHMYVEECGESSFEVGLRSTGKPYLAIELED